LKCKYTISIVFFAKIDAPNKEVNAAKTVLETAGSSVKDLTSTNAVKPSLRILWVLMWNPWYQFPHFNISYGRYECNFKLIR
jgi:hypothetical protein